ncbi:tetratricopeptide repeat protein [Roseibium litorale]|uniref:Tetratricopeptide repeat protein 38 n=1 Tax=Roseibium litorale TaxID=2803841 RepID=A0ABR9CLL1_9HYPH|nr:tetratricopeptide repeat protein [Roseibium litorale]MBD8891739.1 tetratricopeptide repeat protein [Roseibium litorale]
MAQTDQFGYELTLSSPECATFWNSTVTAFLAHGRETPVFLGKTLELDPLFALGHAARGLFCLMLGRREMTLAATEAWQSADAARKARNVTDREAAVVDALKDWLDGWPSRAAFRMDRALLSAPEDAFLLKLVHATRFMMGDSTGMRASIEAVLGSYDETHPAYGYVLGCRAFSLEETGDYRLAEACGKRGLEFAANDAWGLHAVAHVHDMTGRSEEGIAWLEKRPDGWAHCNNFGYHVWWHLALMYLDQGKPDKALELYDSEVRRDRTDDFRDISNAVSLLVRLELEGVAVGSRWHELVHLSDKRAEDGCNVFADLHYMIALANGGTGQAVNRLLLSLQQRATLPGGDMQPVAEKAGLPAAQGLEEFRAGNYGTAFRFLTIAQKDLQIIGGSHAQRDVFDRITIDAALRAGLAAEAEAALRTRAKRRGALDRFAELRLETCHKMQTAQSVMLDNRLRATMT